MYSGYVKGHFLLCLYFFGYFNYGSVLCRMLFSSYISFLSLIQDTFCSESSWFFFAFIFFKKMYKYYDIWTTYMDSYI